MNHIKPSNSSFLKLFFLLALDGMCNWTVCGYAWGSDIREPSYLMRACNLYSVLLQLRMTQLFIKGFSESAILCDCTWHWAWWSDLHKTIFYGRLVWVASPVLHDWTVCRWPVARTGKFTAETVMLPGKISLKEKRYSSRIIYTGSLKLHFKYDQYKIKCVILTD